MKNLKLDNPYNAPAGSIVVVRAGTPGTAHPTAGDIAIADGKGGFLNGGNMGYGGPQNFPKGNNLVMGVYVPKGAASGAADGAKAEKKDGAKAEKKPKTDAQKSDSKAKNKQQKSWVYLLVKKK